MVTRLTLPDAQNGKQLALEARNGWRIPNLRPSEELPRGQSEGIARIHRLDHPNAEPLDTSSLYNCMGLVFASSRALVDIAHLRTTLAADGYRALQSVERTRVGDVVVYALNGRPAHVGVIVEKTSGYHISTGNIKVLSKWGPYGEYLHDLDSVPSNFGEPTEYWTDRILI